jgi:hypothetical protein
MGRPSKGRKWVRECTACGVVPRPCMYVGNVRKLSEFISRVGMKRVGVRVRINPPPQSKAKENSEASATHHLARSHQQHLDAHTATENPQPPRELDCPVNRILVRMSSNSRACGLEWRVPTRVTVGRGGPRLAGIRGTATLMCATLTSRHCHSRRKPNLSSSKHQVPSQCSTLRCHRGDCGSTPPVGHGASQGSGADGRPARTAADNACTRRAQAAQSRGWVQVALRDHQQDCNTGGRRAGGAAWRGEEAAKDRVQVRRQLQLRPVGDYRPGAVHSGLRVAGAGGGNAASAAGVGRRVGGAREEPFRARLRRDARRGIPGPADDRGVRVRQ